MRWLAILAILGYRLAIRPFLRRRCLYPESCSAHGIRLLRERGIRALPAIRTRVRSCALPVRASFVVDAGGAARLLHAQGRGKLPVPAAALELCARAAEEHR
jgi:hypothetical protein